MLITKRNEYALQAMVLLARGRGTGATAERLAGALGTTPAFMAKIAQQLSRAGLVRTRRGRGGGLSLARSPEKILVGDVFKAVDGRIELAGCMGRGPCSHISCPIFPALKRLQQGLDRELNDTALSTLARKGA